MATEKLSAELFEKIEKFSHGFYLYINDAEEIYLMIKLEASLLVSIIGGCQLEIIVRNPNIEKRSCTLYIHDKPNDYFFLVWQCFGKEDEKIKGFDEIILKLARQKNAIKLILFNELTHPIFSADIPVSIDYNEFSKWTFNVNNDTKYINATMNIYGSRDGENEYNGFTFNISNSNRSNENIFKIVSDEYNEDWRQNPSSIIGSFSYQDYLGDGKQGNYQEFSITNNLAYYFTPNFDFYPSPKYLDGNEFTDYIIINHTAAIIIESKYITSNKATKRHQRIRTAINQLNKVEEKIYSRDLYLEKTDLKHKLSNIKVVIKLCLLNDSVTINERNSKGILTEFQKNEMPMFMSVTTFFTLLATLKLKNKKILSNNLFYNMIIWHNNYHNGREKILYVDYFNLDGLTIQEINALQ